MITAAGKLKNYYSIKYYCTIKGITLGCCDPGTAVGVEMEILLFGNAAFVFG